MILVLNNRDSFVFNLSRYFEELGAQTKTIASHAISISEIETEAPRAIVISPGPGKPTDAGVSIDAIRTFSGRIPILGVCLGHQAIAQAFGATVTQAQYPKYGRAGTIRHDCTGLFNGLPDPVLVGLYHSLIVSGLPASPLIERAISVEGETMALQHVEHPTFGVQFHPESILSEHGYTLLKNFLAIADRHSC